MRSFPFRSKLFCLLRMFCLGSLHLNIMDSIKYTRYLNCKPSQFKSYETYLLINLNAAISLSHALTYEATRQCRCAVDCACSSVEGEGLY